VTQRRRGLGKVRGGTCNFFAFRSNSIVLQERKEVLLRGRKTFLRRLGHVNEFVATSIMQITKQKKTMEGASFFPSKKR